MADTKISALPAATTPLAGTEVLPIVQSSVTVKVSVDNLTVKNIRSNATNGILQIAGPAAAATRVMTTPDANFTAARTDATQSFTGDQTLSTGNIIQGTAAKGVNFTANTAAAGMTSQLLNWYEQGTFTPVAQGSSTAGTASYSTQIGQYTRIGNRVLFNLRIVYTGGTGTGNMRVGGLPFTSSSAMSGAVASIYAENLAGTALYIFAALVATNATYIGIDQVPVGGGGAIALAYDGAADIQLSGHYFV